MEKKPATREETYRALDRLERLMMDAEDDPAGYGMQHRQEIINMAGAFVNGEYAFVPASNEREVVEADLAELRDIKSAAKDIRARALNLPVNLNAGRAK
jgi:hypothetical protein